MRKLQVVILFAVFLMVMSGVTLLAQGNETRTSGAKAAYGYPTDRFSTKKQAKRAKRAKKAKKRKKHRQPAKKNKNAAPQYRKKNPWVN